MAQLQEVGKCKECGGACLPVPVSTNLPASEWYCEKCHISYRMNESDARALLLHEAKQSRGVAPQR